MSWKKELEAIGLSGHMPREVVRGTLTPLDTDPFGAVVMKDEVRNTLYCNFKC